MKYFLDPFGCVKNQVDAENMMAYLDKAGWKSTSAEDADLIIVNSCGFIESAKQESINAVLGWRKLYPDKKILLAGCLSQRYAKELEGTLTEADGFFGVENIAKITQAANLIIGSPPNRPNLKTSNKKATSVVPNHSVKQGERPLLSLPGSAYVKISEGCDNCCSYCAIPLIRGSLKSRTIADIVEECKTLLDRGIKELCIIGQDIGSYGTDWQETTSSGTTPGKTTFGKTTTAVSKLPDLLEAISQLKGNFWVRLLYIHPNHFPMPILDIMEKDKRFLPYFDIPFQHASSKILAAMNRCNMHQDSTAETYLDLLATIRRRLPASVIRSTFLVGFPGEAEEDFSELLDFQEKARLDWLGCFAYSREEGTAAYSMKERISKKTAAARKQLIEERQIPITEKNMERFVAQTGIANQTLDILLEEQISVNSGEDGDIEKQYDKNFWLGRLYCHAPEIDGAAVIVCDSETERKNLQAGALVPCKVIARRGFDLEVQFK